MLRVIAHRLCTVARDSQSGVESIYKCSHHAVRLAWFPARDCDAHARFRNRDAYTPVDPAQLAVHIQETNVEPRSRGDDNSSALESLFFTRARSAVPKVL